MRDGKPSVEPRCLITNKIETNACNHSQNEQNGYELASYKLIQQVNKKEEMKDIARMRR